MLDIVSKTISLGRALLTGENVSDERMQKRVEICNSCDKAVKNGETMHCGVCRCKLKADASLINLARYEETSYYGCKHPSGSRWRAGGV